MLVARFSKEGAKLERVEKALLAIESKFSSKDRMDIISKNINRVYEGETVDLADRLDEILVALSFIEKNYK